MPKQLWVGRSIKSFIFIACYLASKGRSISVSMYVVSIQVCMSICDARNQKYLEVLGFAVSNTLK